MKKILIIPALVLSAGSFFLTSCGSADKNNDMKSPATPGTEVLNQPASKEAGEKEDEENDNDDKKTTTMQTGTAVTTDARAKTIENLQAAFKGETTASAKYTAYSQKAEQEGYHEIALLFKAASVAENIHANNHKAVLKESGVSVPVIKPEFTVTSTKANLEDAIKGETYEATVMYPEFLKAANEADNQLALISLNYAYKTEKKHRVLYEKALAALELNSVNTLPTVYYICPTCGNTYETTAPSRCGISMTSSEKFRKITSL